MGKKINRKKILVAHQRNQQQQPLPLEGQKPIDVTFLLLHLRITTRPVVQRVLPQDSQHGERAPLKVNPVAKKANKAYGG